MSEAVQARAAEVRSRRTVLAIFLAFVAMAGLSVAVSFDLVQSVPASRSRWRSFR
jgi:hypothetical protein